MSALTIEPPVSLFEPAPAQPTRHGSTQQPQHGRRARRTSTRRATTGRAPAVPRARRASASSTLGPAVIARSARQIAVRVAGTGLAASAVTLALASKAPVTDAAALAALSVRGLAAAAVLCAAWGFQDRSRLGALATVRAWYGTAAVLALAHVALVEAGAPGGVATHPAATVGAFTLDVLLVVTPALLGARGGRPGTATVRG